ncbi:hypothetical protein BD311DRAFT_765042, partial [Dichomitus squalens]
MVLTISQPSCGCCLNRGLRRGRVICAHTPSCRIIGSKVTQLDDYQAPSLDSRLYSRSSSPVQVRGVWVMNLLSCAVLWGIIARKAM